MKQGWKQMDRNIGVHATHCCKICGCKYGDEDCPVVNGEVVSEYPCESRHDTYLTMDESRKIIKILETYRLYIHLTEENFYIGPLKKIFDHHKEGN